MVLGPGKTWTTGQKDRYIIWKRDVTDSIWLSYDHTQWDTWRERLRSFNFDLYHISEYYFFLETNYYLTWKKAKMEKKLFQENCILCYTVAETSGESRYLNSSTLTSQIARHSGHNDETYFTWILMCFLLRLCLILVYYGLTNICPDIVNFS